MISNNEANVEMVSIRKSEYLALKDGALFLQFLQEQGVDNWDPGMSFSEWKHNAV